MTSLAFERFRFSFFDDSNSARTGLDMKALATLGEEEHRRAETMMLQCLPDTRSVIGLGALHSSRAEHGLIRLFEATSSDGGARIDLARSLWQIRPDQRWLNAVIDTLGFAEEPMQRQIAAEPLRDFRDPTAVGALLKALNDPDALVRYHSALGLLLIHGLPNVPKKLDHVTYSIMSNSAKLRETATLNVLDAIAGRLIFTKARFVTPPSTAVHGDTKGRGKSP